HTDYSMLDGCSRIDRLMARACDMNMRAVAITDHGNLFGLFDFWNEAKQRSKGDVKLKPLLGCELYLVWDHALTDKPDRREHKYFHMGVLARNFKGYQNLTKLVSDAHVRGLHYKPRTDLEQLAKHADGLIGFSGCLQGVIPQALLRGDYEAARKACGKFVEIFGRENFVIELMDHGLEEQKRIIADLLKLAGEFQLRVVATNDVHYVDAGDSVAHDAMLCIQTGARLADERRMRYSATEFYLKSEAEMLRVFGEVPESIKNTVAIAEMCDVKLPVGQNNYPVYIFSEGVKPKASDKIDAILDGYEKLKNGLLVAAGKPGDFVIEGMVRNSGKHACGMIIADRPLTDIIPVTMQEGDLTTQYAKDPVEARLRHRLLHAPARPGRRLRPQEVRRGPRRQHHHLRHVRRQDGRPRPRAHPRPAVHRDQPPRQARPRRHQHLARGRAQEVQRA
ncbi:MAG: PHP domain-containing protein, partial [Verrucomicrobia bacterium]|nr:PHP domain-containing protein [Verrucomicrobiota bacterium]